MLRAAHAAKAKQGGAFGTFKSTNSSSAYVRRPKQPKLIVKPQQQALEASQSPAPPIQRKPRVPIVPPELRASSKSPSHNESMLAAKPAKKPNVPKVADLMPNAKLLMPKKVTKDAEVKNTSPLQ